MTVKVVLIIRLAEALRGHCLCFRCPCRPVLLHQYVLVSSVLTHSRPPPRRTPPSLSPANLVLCVRPSRLPANPSDKVKSSKEIKDEELKNLIASPLRAPKKKNKKTAAKTEA